MSLFKFIEERIRERELWALRRQLGIPNDRRLWVLACMDERLPVEEVLGLKPGDAHIFRNAGGLVTSDAIRSAVLSIHFFGTKEIIILNHTECGMMSATTDFVVRELLNKVQVKPEDIDLEPGIPELGRFPNEETFGKWFRMFDEVDRICQEQVRILREHPLIPDDVVINGYVYEVETGHLRKPFQRLSYKVNTSRDMGART